MLVINELKVMTIGKNKKEDNINDVKLLLKL